MNLSFNASCPTAEWGKKDGIVALFAAISECFNHIAGQA